MSRLRPIERGESASERNSEGPKSWPLLNSFLTFRFLLTLKFAVLGLCGIVFLGMIRFNFSSVVRSAVTSGNNEFMTFNLYYNSIYLTRETSEDTRGVSPVITLRFIKTEFDIGAVVLDVIDGSFVLHPHEVLSSYVSVIF